jgi:hypothetical protein
MNNCLVAVLDIMGFSNFIEKNSNQGGMQRMSALLHTIQSIVSHVDLYSKKPRRNASSFVKKKMVVFWFSDTVIMMLPKASSNKDNIEFVTAVKDTALAMFKEGLPIRGCIDYGDCLYNEHGNFLLGSPFIRAHRESEKLCFSGLVITDEALKVVNDGHNISGVVVLKVPIKGIGKVVKESRNCIQWCDEDDLLKDEIYRSFSDHDKSVNNRGWELINNTHEVLRMFKHSQNGVN